MRMLALLFSVLIVGCATESPKKANVYGGNMSQAGTAGTVVLPSQSGTVTSFCLVAIGSECTDDWPEAKKIATLRIEAHKRGLTWHILCSYSDDGFFGMAFQRGHDYDIFVEDNAPPHWYADGKTQGEVAIKLFALIHEPANQQPQHKRDEKKNCKPELSGN